MGESWNMNKKELDRYIIIQKVLSKELRQNKAAQLLGISTRQLRNLQTRVESQGPQGIISKAKGRPGNRKIPDHTKQKALALMREKYEGFGPTLANEKLEQWHDIKISEETLRTWMIEMNLWIPKVSRKKIHLSRPRRDCFGELIQADGSPEYWFGEMLSVLGWIRYHTNSFNS